MTLKAQQYSKGYLDSVKEFYRQWSEKERIYPVFKIVDNASDSFGIKIALYEIRQRIKDGELVFHSFKQENSDSVVLSSKEVNYALWKIKGSQYFSWPTDFFPNAEIYHNNVFTSLSYDTSNQPRTKKVYCFLSLPVFLKNGKFCLLFQLYYCGSDCGNEDITLYKNEKGYWRRYGAVMQSIF
jgi:hypothetical protein